VTTQTLDYAELFVDGGWRRPAGTERITVTNPADGTAVGSAPLAGPTDVDHAVAAARRAFDDPDGWSSWTAEARAEALDRLADCLEKRADEMAVRVSRQNGVPLSTTMGAEGQFPVLVLRYYAELIRDLPVEVEQPARLGGTTVVRHDPIGVVAAIAPWNAPQALTSFKYAPALAAGCCVVIKPSPETVLDAALFAEAVAEAGLPPGVVNVLPGGRETGAYLVEHHGIDKVAFTGSTAAGRAVAQTCGRLLRPLTLELGGKSAAVFLDDVDLTAPGLAERLFAATLVNAGQVCYLGTRILAPRSRLDEIVEFVADMARTLILGDPLDPATQMGPLVSAAQRDRVESVIAHGVAEGGRIVAGGARPTGLAHGAYLQPTVFTGLPASSPVVREEIFGPVLTVLPHEGDDDAVRLANDSEYGLGGSVWTADAERGLQVARRVRTGTFGVNRYQVDPAAPFGGVKASGLGRELGPDGLRSYQSVKAIYR